MPHDSPAPPATETGVASWYVPGRSDGFGDRLLMFDNVGTPSLELLRFRPDLSANRAFEQHLRERVHQLRAFKHPAFTTAHRVERLGDEGLALVSMHVEGQPLSATLSRGGAAPVDPQAVASLLGELLQALQALHAEGAAHGAITSDRLVVSPGGGVRITEHVLGAALQQLPLLPSQLWREFGLVSGTDGRRFAEVSARSDLVQTAAVGLSMLLARPVTQADLEQRLPALVEEASRRRSSASSLTSRLKQWLEGAFRAHADGYATAADARRELQELAGGRVRLGVDAPSAGPIAPAATAQPAHRTYPSVSELVTLTNFPSEEPPRAAPVPDAPADQAPARTAGRAFTFEFVAAPPPGQQSVAPEPARRVVSLRLAVAIGALAVVEAAVIVALAARVLMP